MHSARRARPNVVTVLGTPAAVRASAALRQLACHSVFIGGTKALTGAAGQGFAAGGGTMGMGRWRRVDFHRHGGGSSMAMCSGDCWWQMWASRELEERERGQARLQHGWEDRVGGAHREGRVAVILRGIWQAQWSIMVRGGRDDEYKW
jgi:hypothetical protein